MFKEKYAYAINEYEKFWERKNTKRCILNIQYQIPGAKAYRAPTSLEEQWLDMDYRYEAYKHNLTTVGHLAEGLPMMFTNFGPGCLSACIGGDYGLAPKTIWFDRHQYIKDFDNPPPIKFDEESEMWQNVVRFQEKMKADPDIHFSITDLGGIMDIVASLRTTEPLLYDLYDYPEELKEFSKQVTELWLKAYQLQVEIIRNTDQPYNNWLNLPSSKPWYPIQCDFSYMISPVQFEEFILSDLVTQVEHLERSIYHLDGVGELPHVDMLLNIPNLTGIQWVSGDGSEPLYDQKWFPLYKKIQDKKKNIVLLKGIDENNIDAAEPMIKTLDPTGVSISVKCSSKEKAEEVLEKVTRWSE